MIQEEYNQEAVDAFVNTGRPIPGQSLTSNPDEPRPFEGPPEFTNFKEALDYTVVELLEPEAYLSLMGAVGDNVPILDLVMQITYVGFREGKWNPDLMLMLIEPLIFVLMSLAEKAGIEYRIDSEDDDEDDDTLFEERAKNIADVAKEKLQNSNKSPSGLINQEILQKIEEAEVPESLLAKTEEPISEEGTEEEVEEEQSLLSRG
jgi:chorismate mutase